LRVLCAYCGIKQELNEDEISANSDMVRDLQKLPDIVDRLALFTDDQFRTYAEQLKELGKWQRFFTLKKIQSELGTPFKEVRDRFQPPT